MKTRFTLYISLIIVMITTPLPLIRSAHAAQQADANGSHAISEEAQVYRAEKGGVVTVESDFGHGSGFVVDQRGLVLTNQHVTNGTAWLALRFGRGVRVPAAVVYEDKESDVAVVCFNPTAVKSYSVVPLADKEKGVLAVEGERVLAIGNPLHQDTVLTTGIVSKVENDVIISNVNINHGSSGGPLLNLSGQAIGITTFADLDPGTAGISGIIAINKATHALEEARAKLPGLTLPSANLLPDVSPIPIPPAALSAAAEKTLKPVILKVPNFVGSIITPFIVASHQAELDRESSKNKGRHSKSAGKPDTDPVRFWEQYVGGSDEATVTFHLTPEVKETNGSRNRSLFATLLGGVTLGVPIPTKHSFEFKADFTEMKLFRGESVVEPVRRNRVPVSRLFNTEFVKMKDKSYGGVYLYDPSAFRPGEQLKIMVQHASDPSKWDTILIDPKVQQRIWDEFEPYRVALAAAPTVPDTNAAPPTTQ